MLHNTAVHLLVYLALAAALFLDRVKGQFDADIALVETVSPFLTSAEAKNVRISARYHFEKAWRYYKATVDAERHDNPEEYAKNLKLMRKEDVKWLEASRLYDAMRVVLEGKIRHGDLKIAGFTIRSNKSAIASFFDRLLGRAQQ